MAERPFGQARERVADACRILASQGLVETTLGHVSLRVGDGLVLVRARGAHERGLRYTTARDVVLVDYDGVPQPGEDDLEVPAEYPIHGELLRARPGDAAVVHAHPPAVVACTITDTPLRPIVGSYNIPAMWLAVRGIPLHRYAGLVRSAPRAAAMLAVMGDHPVCLLQGHGLVAAAGTLEEAVLCAIDVDALAKLTVTCAQMPGERREVDPEDYRDLPEFGREYAQRLWRFYLAQADSAGG